MKDLDDSLIRKFIENIVNAEYGYTLKKDGHDYQIKEGFVAALRNL